MKDLRVYGGVENLLECLFGETCILAPKGSENLANNPYPPVQGRDETATGIARLTNDTRAAASVRRGDEPAEILLRVAREFLFFKNTARIVFEVGVFLYRDGATTSVLDGDGSRPSGGRSVAQRQMQEIADVQGVLRLLYDEWARGVGYVDASQTPIGSAPSLAYMLLALTTNKPLFVTLDYMRRRPVS